jgi:hypothetical protein
MPNAEYLIALDNLPRHLDVAPMITALHFQPSDFEYVHGWLHHVPSRHRFQFERNGRVTIDAHCGCAALSVKSEQADDLHSMFQTWRQSLPADDRNPRRKTIGGYDPRAEAGIGPAHDAFGQLDERGWRRAASRPLSNDRRAGFTIANFSRNPSHGHGDGADLDPLSRNGAVHRMAAPSVFGRKGPTSHAAAAVAGRGRRVALGVVLCTTSMSRRPAGGSSTTVNL